MPFAGEPLEIGFNPEFLRDGLRERRAGRGRAQADQPAAPGPARGRRRQRLPLPDHADPPERLRRVSGRAACALRDFRTYERAEVAPGARPDGRPRAATAPARRTCSRRSTSACTGRSCRTGERPRAGALRRAALRGSRSTSSADDGAHELARRATSPAQAQAADAPTARRSSGCSTCAVRPLVSVFLPDRLELVKGAPAGAPRPPRPGRRRALAGPRRAAPRATRQALAQRNALLARVRAGRHVARRRCATWDLELGRHGAGAARRPRDAPPSCSRPAFARGRRRARPRPAAPSCATARAARAATAEELAAELQERRDADLERGFTGARSAPRRARAARATAASCAPTARRASSGWPCSRCCSPSATRWPRRAATPPLLLLDDVMSELDAERRERLVARVDARRAGRGHHDRPRARPRRGGRPASSRLAVRDGAVHEEALAAMSAPPPARAGRRRDPRARRPARAGTTLGAVQRVWAEVVGERRSRPTRARPREARRRRSPWPARARSGPRSSTSCRPSSSSRLNAALGAQRLRALRCQSVPAKSWSRSRA